MSDLSWLFDIEDKILTIVKTKATPKLIAKYPKLTFTTSNKNVSTNFPTVQIQAVTGTLIGNNLENGVEGTNAPFQIDVYSDKSQADAKYVMKVVAEIFVDLGYTIVFPSFDNETTVYRCTMRVTRAFGNVDNL